MLKIKAETFKDIVGYDGLYQIGDKGTVIGFSRSDDERYKNKQWVLKQYKDRNGYIYANELTKKRVGKFDEFGCIEIYESISEASRKTGISIASISYSANGKRATGGGYIWHFV